MIHHLSAIDPLPRDLCSGSNPQGGSQLSLNGTLEDPMLFSGLHALFRYVLHIN